MDLNHLRMQLTADIAERTSSAKIAIVKAEDARNIGDLFVFSFFILFYNILIILILFFTFYLFLLFRTSMKEWLGNLESENNELLKGYLIRQKNHEELLSSLREVNKIIQFASRFRRLN